MSFALRPCLKGRSSPPATVSNHPPIPSSSQCDVQRMSRSPSPDYFALPYAQPFVHFPPTPTMTTTHVVDPPQLYDRTPIVVSENDCELPKRGCPGRTYTLQSACPLASEAFMPSRGNHTHPSAMKHSMAPRTSLFNDRPNQGHYAPASYSNPPGLVFDESSSEESDGLVSPPPESIGAIPLTYALPSSGPVYCHPACVPHYHSPRCPIFADKSSTGAGFRDPSPNPLAFLPHPPSPQRPKPQSYATYTHHTSSREPPPPKKLRTRITPTTSSWDTSSCLGGF